MQERHHVPLAPSTTLRLGGPAARLVEAGSAQELIESVAACDAADEPVLVMAGGSNLVIADEGFAGTVVRVATRGVTVSEVDGRVRLTVAAGEPWDELVARTVAEGLAGLECLSGIPGSTGATPIQNVGAYGEEVAGSIVSVRAFDRQAGAEVELAPHQCGFGYRTSAFKHRERHLVTEVIFELERSSAGRPIRYAELARSLDVAPGERPPAAAVRDAVLTLRGGKGMVIDPDDPESVSAGSFFLNPVLAEQEFAALERRAVERLGEAVSPPAWPGPDGGLKTSAAWLIERAGFHRGYGGPRAALSRKHVLALVNRGGASTVELLALARDVRDGVQATFGVTLVPEPTLVGFEL